MPSDTDVLYQSADEIKSGLVSSTITVIPDAYFGQDSVLDMLYSVFAGSESSVYLAIQLLANDMFPSTASSSALDKHGSEFGITRKQGIQATGTVRFEGDGGTVIDTSVEIAYDPGTGEDLLYFDVAAGGTIPDPGIPSAPTVVDNAVAGNLTGTIEYAITFVTAGGETAIGAESAALNVVASQIGISAIPIGGADTTARNIYRQKNGSGVWNYVDQIADNVTTVYTDNIADGALGGEPPTTSTAQRISLAAQAQEAGTAYNVGVGTVTTLTNAPEGVTGVYNTSAFAGGTDTESTEDYRARLVAALRNPQTGSASDLKTWAEEVDGVETATVFPNDNAGVATNGHATIRISAAGGTVPDAGLLATVQAALDAKDLANATLHVLGFTDTPTDVDVSVTLSGTYTLADVTASVQAAISAYINGLDVGASVLVAGIYSAAFGLPGVSDLVVNSIDGIGPPAANQATAADAKRTAGTITVS